MKLLMIMVGVAASVNAFADVSKCPDPVQTLNGQYSNILATRNEEGSGNDGSRVFAMTALLDDGTIVRTDSLGQCTEYTKLAPWELDDFKFHMPKLQESQLSLDHEMDCESPTLVKSYLSLIQGSLQEVIDPYYCQGQTDALYIKQLLDFWTQKAYVR